MAIVKIQGIQTNNPDYSQGTATQLEVVGVNDNYTDSCKFQWYLMDDNGSILDGSRDAIDINTPETHVICNGIDYQNWYGGNTFPCQYVAQKKGFIII